LLGLGFFLCLGFFLFPLNGSSFTLSWLRILTLLYVFQICVLQMHNLPKLMEFVSINPIY
jgi:hypothetical protein